MEPPGGHFGGLGVNFSGPGCPLDARGALCREVDVVRGDLPIHPGANKMLSGHPELPFAFFSRPDGPEIKAKERDKCASQKKSDLKNNICHARPFNYNESTAGSDVSVKGHYRSFCSKRCPAVSEK